MKRIIALMAMVAVGLGFFLLPQAQQWNMLRVDYRKNVAVTELAEQQTPNANAEILAAAQEYNDALTRRGSYDFLAENAAADTEYQALLRYRPDGASLPATGAQSTTGALPTTGALAPSDAMGRVSIPKIDVSLPFFHGTSEDALSMGAGHIYGTSLPVGGPSTHTVITAHSQLGQNNRFTRIRELELGDEFLITAAGQTIRYTVDEINVVLPTEDKYLQIIPGEDHATLLTCTPLGLNTHRLLVRGVRADLPGFDGKAPELAALPFPWWAAWLVGGIALAGVAGAVINKALAPKPAEGGKETGKTGTDVPVASTSTTSGKKAATSSATGKVVATKSATGKVVATKSATGKAAAKESHNDVARSWAEWPRTGPVLVEARPHGRHVAAKGVVR